MKRILFIMLTCVAVALSIAAQDMGSEKDGDSINSKVFVNNNQDRVEVVDNQGSNAESDSVYIFLIAILVISVISMIISISTYLQKHKKMKENNTSTNSNIESQIADMQRQLSQMKALIEDMLVKQSNLLGEFVARLGTVQQTLTSAQGNSPLNQPTIQPTNSDRVEGNRTRQKTHLASSNKGNSAVYVQTIFVRPSIEGTTIVLTPVSETYADRATFIVESFGNKGTYIFNKAAKDSVINYLDTMLTPYSTCSLETKGNVTSIETKKEGIVEKVGDKWHVTEKVQVIIS